jgi:hypothetical protein
VGAGNLYESTVYRTEAVGRCYTFVLWVHSCNLGPDCGTAHAKPYDRVEVSGVFRHILSTAVFAQQPR